MDGKRIHNSLVDMSVYERLVEDDVETLGYFPATRGVSQLVLIAGAPHLATVDTVPLRLEPLSQTLFVTTATRLLDEAEDYLEAVVIAAADLFPEGLRDRAHDLRVRQQFMLS